MPLTDSNWEQESLVHILWDRFLHLKTPANRGRHQFVVKYQPDVDLKRKSVQNYTVAPLELLILELDR